MADEVNIIPTATVDIIGVYAGHSFKFEMEQFEDDGETPLDFTGTYKLVISKDEMRKNKVMELTDGDGLTVDGNKITVEVSKDDNVLKERRYYYDLHDDIDDTSSYPVLQGVIHVKSSR